MKSFTFSALLAFAAATIHPAQGAIRVAIAGISHESNSFNTTKATLADFEGEDALSGDRKAWLETVGKSNTNAAGMIAGAAKNGIELYPIHFYQATPRGPIDTQGFNTMVSRIIDGLKKVPPMTVCCSLFTAPWWSTAILAAMRKLCGEYARRWGRNFRLPSLTIFTPM